jgi:hypothetical protein
VERYQLEEVVATYSKTRGPPDLGKAEPNEMRNAHAEKIICNYFYNADQDHKLEQTS